MKVLFIDDNAIARGEFVGLLRLKYGQNLEITSTDNLVDFDDLLYHDPSRLEYDKIIMDLRIDYIPDFDEDEYEQWLSELGITERTRINNNTEIVGWDYFVKVIRERISTKEHLDRVMLKSGYVNLVREKVDISLLNGAILLSKGDKNYDTKLSEFFSRKI